MKNNFIIILAGLCVVASCSKKSDIPAIPHPPVTDARDILLKEVNIDRLPAPFYQFAYDNSGFATEISFASHVNTWKVEYQNNRVIRMIDISHDTLAYTYNNDQVVSIRHTRSGDGSPMWRYNFQYDKAGLLKQSMYWKFAVNSADSVLTRKIVLQYYPDKNLQQYDDSSADGNGKLAFGETVKFSGYDQSINVDDFGQLKNFFEDFLYLPQVKLQQNNPAHEILVGTDTDYSFDFTYQLNSKKLPIAKDDAITITRGNNIGFVGTSQTLFSYY